MVMVQHWEEMDARAFEAKMKALLPGADPDAVRSLVFYAAELESEGDYSKEDYFIETYVEFCLITRQHGPEVSLRLLDVCKTFSLNPCELRGAANHLRYGVDPDRIGPLALDGKCERTEREAWEFDEAMDAFENGDFDIPGGGGKTSGPPSPDVSRPER